MAKRVSGKREIESRSALKSLISYWRDSSEYAPENRGNTLVRIPVRAVYSVRGEAPVAFRTEMQIHLHAGPGDGDVHLIDTDRIRIEDYHLHYSPVWQTYQFDQVSKGMNISGTTYRDGLPYSVQIHPTIEDPA